ncbi:MAG: flavin reductase [Bacteroidales bacterium]|nr:flavin reductase [Bacteroidales bacterium]
MKKFLTLSAFLFFFLTHLQCQEEIAPDGFRKITYEEFNEEAIKLIGDEWMLVAAGRLDSYNMMTANWGGLGWLWNKPVAFIFVRPQRYTFEFTERENYFTLTFYEEAQRHILQIMGSKSGRDFDKMNYEGLTAFETDNGSIAFMEARIILECKKIFATTLNGDDFIDTEIANRVYPNRDFHKMYIGEISNIWIKENQE